MSYERVKINIAAYLSNQLHIGIGGATSGLEDKFILLDARGNPFIPASSLKGKMKAYARQLMLVVSDNVCTKEPDCNCDVCQIFGTPGNKPGNFYFNDLRIKSEDLGKNRTTLRTRIAVDRFRHTVVDKALAVLQVAEVSEGVCLYGTIEGRLKKDRFARQLILLLLSLKMTYGIGGGTSVGMGHLKIDREVFIKRKSIWQEVKKWEIEKWVKDVGLAG